MLPPTADEDPAPSTSEGMGTLCGVLTIVAQIAIVFSLGALWGVRLWVACLLIVTL